MNKPSETDQEDPLKLDNQLCFLLYTASRKMTSAYRPLLAELNITYPQYLVMLVLWESIGSPSNDNAKNTLIEQGVKVGLLSEKLSLDSGTLTPLLKRLEKQGLITRRRDSNDERVVRIGLTDEGACLKQRASKVPQALLCNSGLSKDDFSVIYSELHAVLKKIPGLI